VDGRSEAKSRRAIRAVAAASDDALCTLLSAGLRVQAEEDRWRVIGNTLVYRLLLREAGGTWNKLDQCWDFSGGDPTARSPRRWKPGRPAPDTMPPRPNRSLTITAIADACEHAS
jgi:hypothetical protein